MRVVSWLPWLLVAIGAAGCAQREARGYRRPAVSGTSDSLQVVERDMREIDVTKVERLPQVDQILGYPRALGDYHALGPAECQCLAARASKLGHLFDGERRALAASDSASGCCSRSDNSLTYDVLRTAALEARNRSAGDALDVYYRLAENEARLELLAKALTETRQAVAKVARLRQQGLKMPPDENLFVRREIELRDQQAQAEVAVSQLTAQLWQLIGLEPSGPHERIWPTTDLAVVVERQDVESAVHYGLAMRPELRMLRRLRGNIDEESLPAARAALAQVNPLLGMAPQPSGTGGLLGMVGALKKLRAGEQELPERRRQLNAYARNREQEVGNEVRQAAETVELRLRQIALAKETLEQIAGRRTDVETRATTGGATFADVTAARLALVEAEGHLLDKVVAWKIAEARLKQAQGLLIAECGP